MRAVPKSSLCRVALPALLLLCALPLHAQSGPPEGGEGPPEMGGDGPPRPPKPVKRERFDKLVAGMFQEADTNRDNIVTMEELHALIEARRDAAIRARFAKVDANHDGTVSLDEFLAWQRQMGALATSEAAAFGDRSGFVADSIMPDPGRSPDDRLLAAIVAPLNATVIAQANTNYDAGVSLAELIAFEGQRFDAADTDHDGFLSMDELHPPTDEGTQPPGRPGFPGGRPPRRPPGG